MHAQLVDRQYELEARVEEIRAQRARDQPRVDDLTAEMQRLAAVVNTQNRDQAELSGEVLRIRARTAEIADSIASLRFVILNGKQECDKLRSQIVPSPERMKRELAELADMLQHERDTILAHERKSRDLQLKLDSLAQVETEIQRVMRLMKEVEVEMQKSKAAVEHTESIQESHQRAQLTLKELTLKEQQMQRQIQAAQERLQRLQRQHEGKRASIQQARDAALREKAVAELENRSALARIDANRATAADLSERIADLKRRHAEELSGVSSEYAALHRQVQCVRLHVLSCVTHLACSLGTTTGGSSRRCQSRCECCTKLERS